MYKMFSMRKMLVSFKSIKTVNCAINLSLGSQMKMTIVLIAQSCYKGAIHIV